MVDRGKMRDVAVAHKILICDDSKFLRQMMKQVLEDAGFEVVGEAETGVEAITKYQELKPDLVTMDVVMPEMSGADAVREIMQGDAEARIIMCSAMGQKQLVTDALRDGARDFVVKPFENSELVDAVERALQ